MPYQVRTGRLTAIVADEKEALEMVRRLTASGEDDDDVSVRDVFGDKVDIATLKAMLGKKAFW